MSAIGLLTALFVRLAITNPTTVALLFLLVVLIVATVSTRTNAVTAEPEWVEPGEIVEAAAYQVEHALAKHKLEIDPGAERALVRVDPRLTSAALAHLLENAAQYSPMGSTSPCKSLCHPMTCGLSCAIAVLALRRRISTISSRGSIAALMPGTALRDRNGTCDYPRTAGG